MTPKEKEFELLTRQVRACFNRLRTFGDKLHEDVGITAAQRAVIETLFESGPQTVPAIARSKSVSRQHIQVIVDTLMPRDLVEARENPAHKRSPLIALTKKGQATFEAMRRKEFAALTELSADFNSEELETAQRTLHALRGILDFKLKE